MEKKIAIGIIGGAGYTGGELIRLLINHPNADIAFINSKSNAGNNVSKVHQDLIGETDLQFSEDLNNDIDVLFLCVGHGDAKKFLEANAIAEHVKIIDLSQDFRLSSQIRKLPSSPAPEPKSLSTNRMSVASSLWII